MKANGIDGCDDNDYAQNRFYSINRYKPSSQYHNRTNAVIRSV